MSGAARVASARRAARVGGIVPALLLAACAQAPATTPPADATPTTAPTGPDDAATTAAPIAPGEGSFAPATPSPAAGPSGRPPLPPLPTGPAAFPGGAPGRALGGLLPPGAPGSSATHVTGCAAGGATPAPTRALPSPDEEGPALQVTPTGLGLIVTRRVEHACCLTFEVSTALEGATVVLRERSLGTACRCRCGSTLRTTIALPTGEWLLRVHAADGTTEERSVRVTGLGG